MTATKLHGDDKAPRSERREPAVAAGVDQERNHKCEGVWVVANPSKIGRTTPPLRNWLQPEELNRTRVARMTTSA